ncbi:MAG: hypothetical protein NC131_06675 [Roseburia sp.]|nr:hypothetical protein [Roseburia sp.]
MEMQKEDEYKIEKITPWYLLDMLKPMIKDEFIALCRVDRTGLRLTFQNGQKFHLTIKEI